MTTRCYAMVRGSSIRVTGLDVKGDVGDPVVFATSKSVASVRVNEIVEPGNREFFSTPEEEKRLHFQRHDQVIRYSVDINFLRVDPGLYSLVASALGGSGSGGGFGEGGFGEMEFGSGGSGGGGTALDNGIEVNTRSKPVSFALEVWSKLAQSQCEDGVRQWGYTLFQHLYGGRISGFVFSGGLVSFNVLGAKSRRTTRWGVGPYDLEGPYERMVEGVSRNNVFRQMITSAAPPAQADGVQTLYDVVSNGDAANPMPDPDAPLVLSGGGATTSPYIISGGRA